MSYSANEVMTLAAKAARGAGAPPAQASNFGRAVVRHLLAGRDAGDLSNALDALPDGPVIDLPIAFARLQETAGASGQIDCHSWPHLAQSYAVALPFATETDVRDDVLHITADLQTPAPKTILARIELPDALLEKMTHLAARILVPESDASRLAGAGAGLSDND